MLVILGNDNDLSSASSEYRVAALRFQVGTSMATG